MPSSASWLIRGTRPTVRQRDAARGHAEPVGCLVGHPADRADDGLVVGHRLAHAHEHHVGDPARAAGDLAARQGASTGDDLLDDLGGGHVALQAALAGRAERAGHPAAGLRGHAHRDPARVAHQHRLDEGAVEQLPQRLAGRALVGLERAQRRHQVGQQRGDDLLAVGGRQVGHLRGVVDQPGEVVRGELLGPEAGQSELGDQRLALLGREVGEVARRLLAATRLVEDEGKGLRLVGHVVPVSHRPAAGHESVGREPAHTTQSTMPAAPAAASTAR